MSIENSYMKLIDVLKELGYEKIPSDVKHLDVYQSKKNKTFEIYVKRHYDTYVETEKNFKVDFGITYKRLKTNACITKVEKGETPESFFDRCIDLTRLLDVIFNEETKYADTDESLIAYAIKTNKPCYGLNRDHNNSVTVIAKQFDTGKDYFEIFTTQGMPHSDGFYGFDIYLKYIKNKFMLEIQTEIAGHHYDITKEVDVEKIDKAIIAIVDIIIEANKKYRK